MDVSNLDILSSDGQQYNKAYIGDKELYQKIVPSEECPPESPIEFVDTIPSGSTLFDNCILDMSKIDTSITNGYNLFYDFKGNEIKNLDMLDISSFTSMESMFYTCKNLITLDLSGWDTSNVTNMHSMFYKCESLTSLDLSNFNTSNVTQFCSNSTSQFATDSIFYNCKKLIEIKGIENFDISNITSMNSMFMTCSSLISLDLSNWNTSNVTNMHRVFSDCKSLTSLDVSNWDINNVIYTEYMFDNCNNLTHIKCKQSFKDWCFAKASSNHINKTPMKEGGEGVWEIID